MYAWFELASFLERITRLSHALKLVALRDFVAVWRRSHPHTVSRTANNTTTNSNHGLTATTETDSDSEDYLLLSLLLPNISGREYGIKDKTLGSLYVKQLGLAVDSPDAKRLLSHNKGQGAQGDFGDCLAGVLLTRCTNQPSAFTLGDINLLLARLASDSKGVIRDVVRGMDVLEQTWFSRLVLKDLRLGVSRTTLLPLWNSRALALFQSTSDLRLVAALPPFTDDDAQVEQGVSLSFERPFEPQRCTRASDADLHRLLTNGPVQIETKIDGERIQMHYRFTGDTRTARWFSRKRTEWRMYGTEITADGGDGGSLFPYIASCFKTAVESCILDGEMVAVDAETGAVGAFGSLRRARGSASASASASMDMPPPYSHPCYMVFDIVYLNGKSLCGLALSERRKLLAECVRDKPDRLVLLPYITASTVAQVYQELDQRMLDQQEGIVLKNPRAKYTLGEADTSWIKMKAEYMDALNDDLDLLIVGASYGKGRNAGKLSRFTVAVKDGDKFMTIGDVGSGYRQNELDDFLGEHEGKWVKYDVFPSWLRHPPTGKRPDVLINDPGNSRLVQVRASQVTQSAAYGCGRTLRFPRVIKLRPDKPIQDCMTVQDVLKLSEKVKQAIRPAETIEAPVVKKQRVMTRVPVTKKVMDKFTIAKGDGSTTAGKIFDGLEVCLLPMTSKPTVEKLLKTHGATIVANTLSTTNFAVCDRNKRGTFSNNADLKVKNLEKSDKVDILDKSYIEDCVGNSWLLKRTLKYLVHGVAATLATLEEGKSGFKDDYYSEPLSPTELADVTHILT